MAAALVTAMVVALITTPVVRALAFRVGAVDVPKDSRRMHDHPIPRMGGLAIFFGFILSAIIYVEITPQFQGMMLGAVIIVVLGIFDDIYALGAKFKLLVQIVAALVAVHFGNVIQIISNPNVLSPNPYWDLGWLAVPCHRFMDRGHHQRSKPDRRAGRTGLRCLHHQLYDHAGHLPGGGRWAGSRHYGRTGGGMHRLSPL